MHGPHAQRAHIADPHIVRKLSEGREEDIRPCVGAGYCLDRIYGELAYGEGRMEREAYRAKMERGARTKAYSLRKEACGESDESW